MTWKQHKQTNTRRTWYTSGTYIIQSLRSGDFECWYGASELGSIYLGSAGLLGGAKNLCEMHHQLKESVNV